MSQTVAWAWWNWGPTMCWAGMMRTKKSRRGGKPRRAASNQIFQIAPAVNHAAHFHGIADHHVKDGEILDLDAVIGAFALTAGAVRFKGFRTVQPILNGPFHLVHQVFRSQGIPQTIGDIIHDLIQVILKQGENIQLIAPSVHGYAPLSG